MPTKQTGDINALHNFNVNTNSGEIYFFGEICDISASFLLKNLNIISNSNKDVKIYLQSEGGCLESTLALYDYISNLTNDVEIIVMGYAYSSACLLLQAGDKRVCMPSSKFMIHQGATTIIEESFPNTEAFILMQKDQINRMVDIFSERTGKKPMTLKKQIKTDCYFHAEEALSLNLIDEIWGS